MLVSPKRGRWAPAALPYQTHPIVPCAVLTAAVETHVAKRKALFERAVAAEQDQARKRTP